jgi:hypothetical protein
MNKKIVTIIGLMLAFLIFSYPVLAASVDSMNGKSDQSDPSTIIEYGKGKEAGLIKVIKIHYVKSIEKGKPSKTTTCYQLGGWKWTTPITYTINPNYGGLTPNFIVNAIQNADKTWDDKTSKTIFTSPVTGAYPWNSYDGKNSISFGNYASSGVIAVTVTWYNRFTKVAVESDILFDTDFTWGDATTTPSVMDLQNIATHEIGHTLGLNDLYSSPCSPVTMYGYSGYGETQKRTLETPDITGLQKIYGS